MTYYMYFIWCTIYETPSLERYVTLIWPLKVIQGQRSQGKLKDHIWLCICASLQNREKVTDQFLRNWSKLQIGHNVELLTFKMTFRAIQPNPSYDMLLMSSQRSFMPKKEKKLLKSFWDWPFPSLKLPPPTKLPTPKTTDKSAFEKLRCHLVQRS